MRRIAGNFRYPHLSWILVYVDQLSSSSSGTQSRVYTQLKFPTILTSEDDGQPIHADALDRQPKRCVT